MSWVRKKYPEASSTKPLSLTLALPKVYAKFQNLDDFNRLRLMCAGTVEDMTRQEITVREGLVLSFYMDDADDQRRPDEIRVEGTV